MEKRGLGFVKYLFVLLFVFMLAVILVPGVEGLQEDYCVEDKLTSVKPVSADVGEDFTVGIQLDNCGEKIPPNVFFNITRKSDDIEVKEPLNTNVGEMGYANSKRFLTYHMYAKQDASPGKHNFETKLIYGDEDISIEKEGNFSVTVESEEPEIALSGITTRPETIYKNDKIILTVEVENSGDGEAKDVRVNLDNLDLEGSKKAYLGKIESDESLPARFVLDATDEGIHNSSIRVQYNAHGESNEKSFPFEIHVFRKDYTNYGILGILIILIILGVFIRQIVLKNKE